MRPPSPTARSLWLALAVLASGCLSGVQSVTLEPVDGSAATGPVSTIGGGGHGGGSSTSGSTGSGSSSTGGVTARAVLVVDRSQGMTNDAAGTVMGGCLSAIGTYSGRGSSCKWNDLLDVITDDGGFLTQASDSSGGARLSLGLAAIPGLGVGTPGSLDYACAAGGILDPPAPGGADGVASSLLSMLPEGGSPVAASLTALSAVLATSGASDGGLPTFVILVLGDAPNCDPSLTASAADCSGDRCTFGACPEASFDSADAGCACDPGTPIPQSCLDDAASIAAVRQLAALGVPTFVVGFGASVIGAPDVAEALAQMGAAGGVGPDGGMTFYPAADASGLAAALGQVLARISGG